MNYSQYIFESIGETFDFSPLPIKQESSTPPPSEKKMKFDPVPLRRSARIRANTISDPIVKETNETINI